MSQIVKAKVINGVLTPLEPLALAEGAEYRLTLDAVSPGVPATEKAARKDQRDWRAAIGAWRDDNGYWENFLENWYASRAGGSREPDES